MYTFISSIIALFIGALLQYFFTQHLDNKRLQRNLRAEAYSDYCKGVSYLSNVTSQDGQYNALTADAKCRISIYGNSSVIAELAKLADAGSTLANPGGRKAFYSAVNAMRQDIGNETVQNHSDLQAVLMGYRDETS